MRPYVAGHQSVYGKPGMVRQFWKNGFTDNGTKFTNAKSTKMVHITDLPLILSTIKLNWIPAVTTTYGSLSMILYPTDPIGLMENPAISSNMFATIFMKCQKPYRKKLFATAGQALMPGKHGTPFTGRIPRATAVKYVRTNTV